MLTCFLDLFLEGVLDILEIPVTVTRRVLVENDFGASTTLYLKALQSFKNCLD